MWLWLIAIPVLSEDTATPMSVSAPVMVSSDRVTFLAPNNRNAVP